MVTLCPRGIRLRAAFTNAGQPSATTRKNQLSYYTRSLHKGKPRSKLQPTHWHSVEAKLKLA
eukprot:10030128-Lingulodinium_polyedra.AAC.1